MKPFNLIISGTGGQGVLGLSKLVYRLCEQASFHCQGSTFKGGAQRRGSIHCVMRIFKDEQESHELFSSQIGAGELDLLMSMEPWEALRYQQFMNPKTKVYVNAEEIPFYAERYEKQSKLNPIEALKELGIYLKTQNFNLLARQKYADPKLAGYLLLKSVIENKDLPFNSEDLDRAVQYIENEKSKTS